MNYIEPHDQRFRKTLITLFLGSFVTFADLYSTQPVIPLIARQFDVTPAVASLTLSFSTGALAFFLLVASFMSGAIERKRLMGTALSLSALLSVLVGMTDNLGVLMVLRAFQGAVLAGFPSIAMAYINEEFTPKSLGYVIGIYVSGSSIGGLAGRLIVGTISDFASWHTAIICLGLISLLISLLFWFMLPAPQNQKQQTISAKSIIASLLKNIRSHDLLLLYGLGFLFMGSFVTVYNYVSIPLMEEPYNLSQTILSFIFLIYLVGTFSSAWMGRLADRIPRKKVMLSGILLMIGGAGLTLLNPLAVKITGLALFTFGFFGSHSIASSWVGLLAERSEKAQASSMYLLFYYSGSSLVGAGGGLFLHQFGWTGVIGLISVLLVISIFISGRIEKEGTIHQIRL
ncbi:MFS transporter [Peribacillus sp. SCS-155]|uniref:MFS transporter n=1 Tax=Peribacillus sedimenti TaxID=3115297 RepID=UPI003905D3B9